MKPVISVLLCAYNSEQFIKEAFRSLLDQTMSKDKFEVIAVNDGSTDSTKEIMDIFCDKLNLVVSNNKINHGLVESCNQGIALAKGDYLLRLDADDRLMPSALEKLYSVANCSQADFIYSDRYEVNLTTGEKILVKCKPFNLFELIAIGVLLRSAIINKLGGFRNLFWEEYDLFIRILDYSNKPAVYVEEPLSEYRRHPASLTANEESVRKGGKN